MWKVLRRYQGEPYEEGGAMPQRVPVASVRGDPKVVYDPFVVNQRTIAAHQCQPYAKPHDPMNLTLPYGNRVYGKMVEHLKHSSVEMRRKAIEVLLELYGLKGEHVVLSLKDGSLPALVECLRDDDEEVRLKSCVALELVANQKEGQIAILAGNYLPNLMAVLDDTSTDVVAEGLHLLWCTHCAFNEFACTQSLIRLGCIKKYVEKARSPSDDVSYMAFAAMGKLFDIKEAFIGVLDAGGMETVTTALEKRTDPSLLVEAADCAGKLAFHSAGKRAAVQCKTASALIPLLQHPDAAVRTACSGALVAVTISEAGKLQAIDNGIVDALVAALRSESERDVLVNEVKTLANISEHPFARLRLHSVIPRLEEIAKIGGEYPSLVESVRKAIVMLRWQPGDHV